MKNSHKNVNLDDKKSQHSQKDSEKNVNLCDKKSQTSAKKTQKCRFKW